MMQLRETRAFVFCGVFHAIAAAPWLIAALLSPHLLLLWGFGALVGALWLTLVGTTLETGLTTALTAAVGGTLGDAAPWALLLLLVPLCLEPVMNLGRFAGVFLVCVPANPILPMWVTMNGLSSPPI
jgi:hypothetical protein